ncbi:serine-type D-Ala-D-Ala carboxypeptidase [Vibrio maerlii]|uniref:serine-type D-Ala-D-Ala carboxypeptidase n=1 Tax=Vibrio maerlii TaxID=2231648 RepID=UPI001F12BF57|nr:serine-type D-Ala-D-Ala carboxypeptidase [Vibrio maerlii]
MRSPLLVALSVFSSMAFSAPPSDLLPSGSRSALVVAPLDGSVSTLTQDENSFYPPASTLKIVTALAAKLELGEAFTFNTSISALKNDKQDSDLVITFSGDPSLERENIRSLLNSAKEQGHTTINHVWLDDSVFSGYEKAVGWPWDILGVCYSAPSSAISLDGNCVQASISTDKNGSATSVFVPKHQPISVSTNAVTLSKKQKESRHCDLELVPSANNQYQISGCLVKRDKPLPLKFAVQNTTLYTQAVIRQEMRQLGMTLNGQIKQGKPQQEAQQIAEHRSESLNTLLETMLKKSNNLYADNITKAIGHKFYLQAGSFSNGTEAIKQIIYSNTGIDINDAKLADGSGLSRNNKMTASDLSAILRYIYNHNDQLGLIELMPKSGEEGTLKYRRSMRKSPIKGNLIAKSGSLYGSSNMAGFGLDKQGKPSTLFVQFVTDYHPPKLDSNKPVEAPIVSFEKAFYKQVVEQSQ